MAKFWVLEKVQASICRNRLLSLLIVMFIACATSYSQDSIFVIRNRNIIKLDKSIEVDSTTFDSLLIYKPLYVCIEPLNIITRLCPSNRSSGHLYPVCYYDKKIRNVLTLHFFRLNDIENEDIHKMMNMPTIETTGNYMNCSTICIPDSDVEYHFSKDTIVPLWNFSNSSIKYHTVEYTYFKIKDTVIDKYKKLNLCHFLSVEIGEDRYNVVSFLKHNTLPINKVIRNGCLLIDNDNIVTTIKVKQEVQAQ